MNDETVTGQPSTERHQVARVRHELRWRMLTVERVVKVAPSMVRVTLVGDELAGFHSAAFDDHVKVFFPAPGELRPVLGERAPSPGQPSVPFPVGPARDYTPRRFDAAARELDIDFALHDAGPATTWAQTAARGQMLGVGGPRGSFVVSDDFDWYLFIGDETAIPAIARRLAELRPGCRAKVIAEVDGPEEEQRFASAADLDVEWLHRAGAPRGDSALFEAAVERLVLPQGEGYAWVACESRAAKTIRRRLLEEKPAIDRRWLKASGYWKRGAAAQHEKIED